MNKINNYRTLVYLTILAFLVRMVVSFYIADLTHPEMWEFGMIARSLLKGDGFVFLALTQNVPSAFMPPGLPFIYFSIFKILGDNSNAYTAILILNAMLGGLSVLLIYKVSLDIFGKACAFISAFIMAFSPIMIYSSSAFNSIIIYQVLLLLSAFLFNKIYLFDRTTKLWKNRSLKLPVLLGVTLGIFLYFRAEVLIFIIIISTFFALKKYYVYAFIIFAVSLLIISPWTARNYITFGKLIPVSTSMGYNFYTGHGDENSTFVYKKRVSQLNEDQTFELKQSDISFDIAFDYIISHPKEELKEALNKIFSLWIVDKYRDSSRHPVYLLSWIPLLILFPVGLFFIFKDKIIMGRSLFIISYLILSTILVVTFFNIPRYQIQMSVLVIPVAVFGLLKIFPKLKLSIIS